MEKKTKLTISGSAKKSIKNIEIAKSQGKNSVVIEKQTGKFSSRGGSFRSSTNKPRATPTFNRGTPLKHSINPKSPPITNDFEKRKLAEQRATKRLKGNILAKAITESLKPTWSLILWTLNLFAEKIISLSVITT